MAEIKTPTLISSSDLNVFSTAGPEQLTNNSGLTPAVNDGDDLTTAAGATHAFGGTFANSWVTNANAPDYFGVNPPAPTFVWDLGSDVNVDNIVLWQYENNGGNFENTGNHARTIDLRFNTEADGSASFSGPATTVSMIALVGQELPNFAQIFGLGSPTARYVEMKVLDNHFGDPDSLGVNPSVGGDRVGIGELRFDVSPVPEPGTLGMLCGAILAGLGVFRRR
jgi:hypothetical protein